ncbi:MAG: hypothetical protein KatS3mg107_1002 [Gemmataceae bacterium]|nr:MAG: hypothetical protein KatS3mg107_1002 [Gemmataceae bacterium]
MNRISNTTGVFITAYMENLTFTGGYYPNPTGNLFGKTNYVGSAGALGRDAITSSPFDGPGENLALYEGVFFNNSKVKVEQIRDGSSSTLMFLETLGGGAPWTKPWPQLPGRQP